MSPASLFLPLDLNRQPLSRLSLIDPKKRLFFSSASVAIDAWGSGSSQYPFNRYADDSRVRPLISFLVGSFHEVTPQLNEDNSETLIRHAVDRSRPLIQRLLNDNLQEDDAVLRPDLVNFLLNSFPTDESNFSLPDSVIFAWTTSRAAEIGNDPLDIRRSLHSFLMVCLVAVSPSKCAGPE